MTTDDVEVGGDAALVVAARVEQDDPVAEMMRANVRSALFSVEPQAARVGRYTVLSRLGAGAMGTIFTAYDPVLERKIALKLLNARGEAARESILREARTLAKLSHPNVVTIHEADTDRDQVFIAMELIDGPDLGEWLQQRPRSWREVVRVFAQAALGLGAAHEAGIVHGDFKPSNVLLAADRVCVADFGMAHDATASPEGSGGTPLYMAPERLRHKAATAASDQFGFAVALYEALYGTTPFVGRTVTELVAAMHGKPDFQPKRSLPRWLRDLVARGLSPTAGDRYPSMRIVAAALARPRDRRLARWAPVGVAAVGVTVFAVARKDTPSDPCARAGEPIDGAYNAEVSAEITAAFASTTAPFADAAASRAVDALQRYVDAWRAEARTTCTATRTEPTQSDSTYDTRVRCLDEQRHAFEALVSSLRGAQTRHEVADAVPATASLPPPARCRSEGLVNPPAVAADENLQAAVDSLRRKMDAVRASFWIGRYALAAEESASLLHRARALQYPPVLAEALLLRGTTQGRVGKLDDCADTLREASQVATEARHDRVAAEAMLQLLRTLMFDGDHHGVDLLAELVSATLVRAGDSPHPVDAIVAESAIDRGDYERALPLLARAVEAETRGDRIAILLMNTGAAKLGRGEYEAALADHQRALQTAREFFGVSHPTVGFHLQRLGRAQRSVGALDESLATLEAALAIRSAAHGPTDRAVASTLGDLAATEMARSEFTRARTHYERAIEIRASHYGAEHSRMIKLYVGLGDAHRRAGSPTDALAPYQRARTIREASTPASPLLASIDARIAVAALAAGDTATAIRAHAAAQANRAALSGKAQQEVNELLAAFERARE